MPSDMSSRDDAAFAEFFRQRYQKLVMCYVGQGTSLSDAEDAAQTVFERMLGRWTTLRNPDAYFRQAVTNELAAIGTRRRGDLARAVGWASRRVELSSCDVYPEQDDAVQECLAILPERQREVLAQLYEGYRPKEIADALGVPQATIRSNKRHAVKTLEPLLEGDGHELRRWMRSGERLHEAFHSDNRTLPIEPRPVIAWAWRLAKELQVDPVRGTERAILQRDEVTHRRRESPVAACAWVLNAMAELAADTEQMMVIVDRDNVVLWRGGDPKILAAADELNFVEGAPWGLGDVGVNGIALASILGTTQTVNRWEHTVIKQHHLSCLAAPIRDNRGQVLGVLNLSGTEPTVHQAIKRRLDTIAAGMHRQLRAKATF